MPCPRAQWLGRLPGGLGARLGGGRRQAGWASLPQQASEPRVESQLCWALTQVCESTTPVLVLTPLLIAPTQMFRYLLFSL